MSEYDPFAPTYDLWSKDMTEDVPFYVDLAREADGPIAELAVGTGRVAIPVVRETGKRVVGIDLSPAMLAIARERAAEAGVDLELREQDMRDFELEEPAALVYSPFRSLLHMPTWADKRRVFDRVAASRVTPDDIIYSQYGPVLAAHVGPRALGVCVYEGAR